MIVLHARDGLVIYVSHVRTGIITSSKLCSRGFKSCLKFFKCIYKSKQTSRLVSLIYTLSKYYTFTVLLSNYIASYMRMKIIRTSMDK